MGQSRRRGRDEKLAFLATRPWARAAGAEDHRWLGAVADEVRAAAGTVVARRGRPARWVFVVADGAVAVAGTTSGPGRCVTAAGGDVVATSTALLLALPAREEPELLRRFPALVPPGATPAGRAPTPGARCPVVAGG